MKAKLIIDMPEGCYECRFVTSTINSTDLIMKYGCQLKTGYMTNKEWANRPDWCPLIPIDPIQEYRDMTKVLSQKEIDELIGIFAENISCDGCKYQNGDELTGAYYCNNCTRNYEEDCYEPIESEES